MVFCFINKWGSKNGSPRKEYFLKIIEPIRRAEKKEWSFFRLFPRKQNKKMHVRTSFH